MTPDWLRIHRLRLQGPKHMRLTREQKRAVLLGDESFVGYRERGVTGATMKTLSAHGLAEVTVERRSPAAYDRFVYRLTRVGSELKGRWIAEDDERQRASGFTNGTVAEAAARTIIGGQR